jgi:type II secretory pathway pseudopilin PulG
MNRRAAFTLVELLVVAGIFASLFGLVLVGVRPGAAGEVRRAAQSIVSAILATQSRALGNPAGAGLIFEPDGAAVSAADMLPLITGSCTSGMPPADRSAATASVTITPSNAGAGELASGYRIQFGRSAPGQAAAPWMGFSGGSTVSLRTANGQTGQNTIWPEPGPGGLPVVIARYPAKGEMLVDLGKPVALDLRLSGIGDGASFDATWSDLANKGPIGLTFDSVGGVDAVMQQLLGAGTATVTHPLSPVYLLVAPRKEVEAGTALASDQALWVVIHPQTGRVSVSSNVPQTGTDATALRAARAKARAQAVIGK